MESLRLIINFAFFFFMFWGPIASILLARAVLRAFLAPVRIMLVVSILVFCQLVAFSPVMWGGEGFGMMIPWWGSLWFGVEDAHFYWEIAAVSFVYFVAVAVYLVRQRQRAARPTKTAQ